MMFRRILPAALAFGLLAGPVLAQRGQVANPYNDAGPLPPPNATYQGPQGFSFPGDELKPSYDRKYVGRQDDRYAATTDEQRREAEKPGGGCLKYGAAGAAGGHLAGHGVVGALAGCAVGSYIRHRDKVRIEQQSAR